MTFDHHFQLSLLFLLSTSLLSSPSCALVFTSLIRNHRHNTISPSSATFLHKSHQHPRCHHNNNGIQSPQSSNVVVRFVSSSSSSSSSAIDTTQEEEVHDIDTAHTTPRLINVLWNRIVKARDTLSKGESLTVQFPEMESQLTPDYVERLMGHFDVCKDVCDDFGVNVLLTPYFVEEEMGGRNKKVTGFTVKSYRNPESSDDDDDNDDFSDDSDWDDGDDWGNIDDIIAAKLAEYGDLDSSENDDLPEIKNRIPDDDEVIIEKTKKWVDKIMSDMGICPFTSGPNKAGLPLGDVFYCVDRSITPEEMYEQYWSEAVRVESVPEKELSTTLMITPMFFIDNVEMFENFGNSLTQPLEPLKVEDLLQLVFFHPEWTFRDGAARSGMGAASNYARRSPWPMINILRTSQVRAAQRGIPTGLVYQQNEKTLNSIGSDKLDKMLRDRDWSDIGDMKVNRRDMEALRVAQDLQSTGVVAKEDTSLVHDSTPAANKVDLKQIEGGDMINVVMQALHKRLTANDDGNTVLLTGTETSAAMMASDFIIEYCKKIQKNPELVALEEKIIASKEHFDEG